MTVEVVVMLEEVYSAQFDYLHFLAIKEEFPLLLVRHRTYDGQGCADRGRRVFYRTPEERARRPLRFTRGAAALPPLRQRYDKLAQVRRLGADVI